MTISEKSDRFLVKKTVISCDFESQKDTYHWFEKETEATEFCKPQHATSYQVFELLHQGKGGFY